MPENKDYYTIVDKSKFRIDMLGQLYIIDNYTSVKYEHFQQSMHGIFHVHCTMVIYKIYKIRMIQLSENKIPWIQW